LLEFCGINPERIQFSWVSAAEGGKWVETINGVVDTVRALGPFVGYQKINAVGPDASGEAATSGETS
jgi:coenzyme F420-reducing hydrogenase delta subunit